MTNLQHNPLCSAWNRGAPGGLAAVLAAVAWGFAWLSAGWITHSVREALVLFDGMHRLAWGQAPHLDFSMPLGVLTVWLPYVGMLWHGGFGGALETADALLLTAVLAAAAGILTGRVTVGPAALVLGALFGLVALPHRMPELQWLPDLTGQAQHWGWALLTALLLVGLPKGTEGAQRWWLDGLCVGVLLSLLLFTKLSFFLVGCVHAAWFGAALGEFRRAAGVGFGLCAAVAAGVGLAGGWLDDYGLDAARALRALDGVGLAGDAVEAAVRAHWSLGAVLLCCGAAHFSGLLTRRLLAHAVFTAVSGVLLAAANGLPGDGVTGVCLFTATAFLVRLALTAPAETPLRRTALLGAVAHLLPLWTWQLMALSLFGAMALDGTTGTDVRLPRLETVRIGGYGMVNNAFAEDVAGTWRGPEDGLEWLRVHPSHSGEVLSHAEYLHTLRSGVALLRETGATGRRVMTLDAQNPFPMLLHGPPPRGVAPDLRLGENVPWADAEDARRVLGDAEAVMVPKAPLRPPAARALLKGQSERLAKHWRTAGENAFWVLLVRPAPT